LDETDDREERDEVPEPANGDVRHAAEETPQGKEKEGQGTEKNGKGREGSERMGIKDAEMVWPDEFPR